jgi:hypothetical protein
MACSPRAARSSSAFGERSDSRIPGLAAVAASTICRVARLRMRAFVDVQHSESRPPPGGRQALARCPRRQLRLCVHRTKRRPCRRALLARLRRDDRQVCPSLPCSRCAPTGTPLARSASRSRRSWGRDALGGSACGAARARAHASPCLFNPYRPWPRSLPPGGFFSAFVSFPKPPRPHAPTPLPRLSLGHRPC